MFLRTAKTALLAALLLLPALTGWLARELHAPTGGPGGATFFEVRKGRSFRAVAGELRDAGIIRSALAVTIAYDLFYSRERPKAGEYEISFPTRAKDVLFKMFLGRVYLRPLTLPEGLTGREIGGLLLADAGVDQTSFMAAFHDTALIADWDPRAKTLEGYLFPDTYFVPRKPAARDLVEAMVGEFRKVIDGLWPRPAADSSMSVRDAVILASMIEKETARPEERRLVSAVFHNRLRLGMKLDCDPTVIYGLKLENDYSGRLLSRDLKSPSPYNTYVHAGLPPGPICNPGRSSLEAALNPAPESYLYFVARGDGSHYFSRSFAQHQEAVRKFQLKKK
jgi:UPF0755 protein